MTIARPDPLKLKLLVETLRTGPFTYEDLEEREALQLSRRSLQLYLETHLPAAGYTVLRGRTSGPRPRATFALPRATRAFTPRGACASCAADACR